MESARIDSETIARCPECGESLDRTMVESCSSCGSELPSDDVEFRPWAVRRVRWDRLERGNVLAAWLTTSLAVLVRPWREAKRIVLPDRYGRAVRWAALHVVAIAFVGALVQNSPLVEWHLTTDIGQRDPPDVTLYNLFDPWRTVREVILAWICWTVALVVPILSAACASWIASGRHPAARLAGAKWALYAAVAYWIPLVSWIAFRSVTAWPVLLERDFGVFLFSVVDPKTPIWIGVAF